MKRPSPRNNEQTKEKLPQSPDAKANVTVAVDSMSAKIVLTAPQPEGKRLTKNGILEALTAKGVIAGVKNEYVERLAKYPIYERSFLIASGVFPIDGKAEELICRFELVDVLAPKVLEDGTTDYKNMGFGTSVNEGDLLADIISAVPAVNGYDVLGREHEGKPGAPLPSPVGTNVRLSEDGRSVLASTSGNASLKDNKVHVRKEMAVTHVDQTTGNIMFAGDVSIKGDVKDGFTVRAGGSINIGGVVENGTVVAGRDVIIKTGIHGESSSVTAGGGVRTGYVEMGKIKAKECIYADIILNADIFSEDKVILTGKRSCIVGGTCHVASYLEAKVIGNDANVATVIEIIENGSEDTERDKLVLKIKECSERIKILSDAWRTASTSVAASQAEKKRSVAQLLESRKDAEQELKGLNMELTKFPMPSDKDSNGLLVVYEHIYPNVSINIDGTVLSNSFMRPGCRITRKKDKILFNPLT